MNIKQIAEAAGVSVATVSRVLNHPENVAPKTRAKIQEIIEKTEYKPNWFAQGLNFNRTKTIGLIIPHILNPMYMEIAKGVEDVAMQKGYAVFMCNVEKDPKTELEYVEELMTRRVDGIIFMFSSLEEDRLRNIEENGVPLVIIGENKDVSGFNAVKVDCRQGAENMVRQLAESGYKDIGILYGNDPEQESQDMVEAYRSVMDEKGLSVRGTHVRMTENTIEGGYLGAKKMMGQDPPRAIFATSDDIAYGAMDAIKDMGLAIPDDVAVAGVGNSRMSSLVEPKLTTVELPFHKMGIYGARLLFDLIEDEDTGERKKAGKPRQITLQTKLRIRKSCGHNERIGEMF